MQTDVFKPENRFTSFLKKLFRVSPFPDYRVQASDETERTIVSKTVDDKNLACDYDKIAMSDPCSFYLAEGEVICATCGKTTRI